MPQARTGARHRVDQSSPHPTETHRAKSSMSQTWPGGGKTCRDESNCCETFVFSTNTIWIYSPHPHHGGANISYGLGFGWERVGPRWGGNFAKARRTTASPQASPEPTHSEHAACHNHQVCLVKVVDINLDLRRSLAWPKTRKPPSASRRTG